MFYRIKLENDEEGAARAPGPVLHPDTAAVQLHYRLGDGQAKTQAGAVAPG